MITRFAADGFFNRRRLIIVVAYVCGMCRSLLDRSLWQVPLCYSVRVCVCVSFAMLLRFLIRMFVLTHAFACVCLNVSLASVSVEGQVMHRSGPPAD